MSAIPLILHVGTRHIAARVEDRSWETLARCATLDTEPALPDCLIKLVFASDLAGYSSQRLEERLARLHASDVRLLLPCNRFVGILVGLRDAGEHWRIHAIVGTSSLPHDTTYLRLYDALPIGPFETVTLPKGMGADPAERVLAAVRAANAEIDDPAPIDASDDLGEPLAFVGSMDEGLFHRLCSLSGALVTEPGRVEPYDIRVREADLPAYVGARAKTRFHAVLCALVHAYDPRGSAILGYPSGRFARNRVVRQPHRMRGHTTGARSALERAEAFSELSQILRDHEPVGGDRAASDILALCDNPP